MSKENRTGAPNMVHIYDVKYWSVSPRLRRGVMRCNIYGKL